MGSLDNISDIITNIRASKQRLMALVGEADRLEDDLRCNVGEQEQIGKHISELNATLLKQAHHLD